MVAITWPQKPFCKGGPALSEMALSCSRGIREPNGGGYFESLIRIDGETRCLGHRPTLHEAGLLETAAEKGLTMLGDGKQALYAWTECLAGLT